MLLQITIVIISNDVYDLYAIVLLTKLCIRIKPAQIFFDIFNILLYKVMRKILSQ